MNRVRLDYTKDKYKTLKIFIIILAIIVSIVVSIICINYKLVYEVKLSDKIIGYIINRSATEKEITDYINSINQNNSCKKVIDLPEYKLKFVQKHIDINDKQVILDVKSKTVTAYKAYPIRFNNTVNVKDNLNTLKLSNIKKYNYSSTKNTISKVSNKNTKKVTTKTTKKTVRKIKKITSKNTKKATHKTKKDTRKNVKKSKSKKTTTKKSNIWRLEIPKIGLKATISEGTSQSVLNKYIGHFTETVRKNGNVGLAAHNRGFAVNYFSKLNKLSKNDIIYYTYKGVRKKYKVVYKKRIHYTDWSKLYYTNDERITMITCVKNKPHLRLCVQAKRIK